MTNEYAAALAALERKASATEMKPLLAALRSSSKGIDEDDHLGLTVSMHAAAHGRLDLVSTVFDLGGSIERRNKLTNANLLHYAAQQPEGGADIVKWAIGSKSASEDLLNERIFVRGEDRETDKEWSRGNGHTVAFECVFNNNVAVIDALINISKDHAVDFTTPAVHGLRPLGWAFQTGLDDIVGRLLKHNLKLGPHSIIFDAQREAAQRAEEHFSKQFAADEDGKWEQSHRNEGHALELAARLRRYVLDGGDSASVANLLDEALKKGVQLNAPYGRFGQPLLILVPTHPDIIGLKPNRGQQDRYTSVVTMLVERGADPQVKEKGLMEVSAGFREVFFGYPDALKVIVESVSSTNREKFVAEQGIFNGYTRLIDAALIGHTEALKILLDYDVDLRIRSIRGFNGWTAREAAAQKASTATAVLGLL